MDFAKKLKKLRTEKGIAINELADKLNLNKELINKWEDSKEEPSLSQLTLLAKFFNVSTDYLLGIENKGEQPLPFTGLFPAFVDLEKEPEKEMDEELMKELIELTKAVDLKRKKK